MAPMGGQSDDPKLRKKVDRLERILVGLHDEVMQTKREVERLAASNLRGS